MKDVILWNHKRGTWQYDVFCLLIIAFIFLTPKSWFEKREKLATQNAASVVKAEEFAPYKVKSKSQNRESGANPNAEIQNLREIKNTNGETFYKIETR